MLLATKCKHTDRNVKAKGMCGSCYNKYLFEKASPEEQRIRLDRIKENWHRRYASKNSTEHALKQRNRALRHRYGLSQQEYQDMFKEQCGVCYLCKKPQSGNKPLFVDHCHTTGKTRKLLCARCNTFIGYIETTPHLLDDLKAYIDNKE